MFCCLADKMKCFFDNKILMIEISSSVMWHDWREAWSTATFLYKDDVFSFGIYGELRWEEPKVGPDWLWCCSFGRCSLYSDSKRHHKTQFGWTSSPTYYGFRQPGPEVRLVCFGRRTTFMTIISNRKDFWNTSARCSRGTQNKTMLKTALCPLLRNHKCLKKWSINQVWIKFLALKFDRCRISIQRKHDIYFFLTTQGCLSSKEPNTLSNHPQLSLVTEELSLIIKSPQSMETFLLCLWNSFSSFPYLIAPNQSPSTTLFTVDIN